jgi:hypothetical protein
MDRPLFLYLLKGDQMADDWRVTEALKELRQLVTCPDCGALVSTDAGLTIHVNWHKAMTDYINTVNAELTQFSDYIINPETGLQKQIEDRLDTITAYVTAPNTGLEPRVVAAITDTNAAITQLRSDATTAINQVRTDATNAITSLSARITSLGA